MKSLIVLTLVVIMCGSGCRREEVDAQGRAHSVAAFFCGCGPCHRLAQSLGGELLAHAEVFYRGSRGDAEEFAQEHGIARVTSDALGEEARARRIDTCPTVMLPDGLVYGNGRTVTEDEIQRVRLALGTAK